MLLIYLSCAWVAGIFTGSVFHLPPASIPVALIPLLLIFLARHHRRLIIFSSLCLITLLAAALYSYSNQHTINENNLCFYNGYGRLEIQGMISEDPDVRDKSTHLRLSVTGIKLDNGWHDVEGTVLIFVPRYPAYRYGDVLIATGVPETPPKLDDFDYKEYLAHQGIRTTMLYPEIKILDRDNGSILLKWVYSARNRMAQTFARVLPEPQASLAQGIILGMRSNIPESLKTDFANTGTTHLLAISGLHMGIITGIMLSAGIWLFGRKRYIYVWLALGTVWLYALLTGMHPPVVRSAIMVSLFLAAELLGRQRSAITALTVAAAIMVGISPYILGDAAFQLSFLAMAGLVFLFPAFRNLGRKAVKATIGEDGTAATAANFTSDSLSATLGSIIAVWPVVAYYFGIFSFAGPLATFLALLALPAIIITGALTGIMGLVALPAAQALGWLNWLLLLYITELMKVLGTPSFSSIEVARVNPAFIWGYYAVLAAVIWINGNRKRLTKSISGTTKPLKPAANTCSSFISGLPKTWVIPPLLAIAVLVSFTAATMPDDNLHVSFLDVGEGDAILIQKGHQQILIDGGPSPQAISLELGNKMPFWDRTIDLLILTHPHQDHLAGLVEVLQRFHVKQVLYPDPDPDYNSPLYDEWHKLINERGIKHTLARAGQQIDLGTEASIKVINPPPIPFTGTQSDIDNNSVVLRLSTGKISFLLAADIMKETELTLITNRAVPGSTVLKAAHHGSDTSTCQEFLAVASPRLAVISAGEDNPFGHPGAGVLDRLKATIEQECIFRTDRNGTIEFITDGESLWVEEGR